jgi:hypothetical protein
MLTLKEKQKNGLVKKFHTLLGCNRIDNDTKLSILAGYGVESSKDLDVHQLIEICDRLDTMSRPELAKLDKSRKRVIACLFGYCRAMGKEGSMATVKAIACRATGYRDFNAIPLERLNSIYNAFLHCKNDVQSVMNLTNLGLLTEVGVN